LKNFIIGPAFPLRGGIANFNEALCRSFIEAGVDSKIVSFSLQYPGILFPGKTQYAEGAAPKGIPIETKINSINPFNWYKVARQIKREKPDYIIIRYWLPFMGPCLGTIAKRVRKAGIKVIAITDNVIPHEKRMGDKMFSRYFIKHCDGFIAMSRSVLNDLEQFTSTPNKKFLPHPIYNIFGDKVAKAEAQQQLGLNSNDKHLLFFGLVRKYKGLDLLLEAMAKDQVKQLGIKLIIAGEFYDDETGYRDQIKRLGIEDRIILRNEYIPSEEVKHYFCAADLVSQTYKTATQSGITQIAYHFERPMLVTDVGGLAEIVPHNKAGFVTSLEPDDIADAIALYYNHNKEEDFTAGVIEEKKRFDWSTFIQGVEELVSELK
jgi:D-inositol-3-phosphate glycosyltransferase